MTPLETLALCGTAMGAGVVNTLAGGGSLLTVPRGTGVLLWCPLPVELSDRPEPLNALYRQAASLAGCRRIYERTSPSPALIILPAIFADTALYACVSETDRDLEAVFTHLETRTRYSERVPAQQAVMLLIDRRSGAVVARYSPRSNAAGGG